MTNNNGLVPMSSSLLALRSSFSGVSHGKGVGSQEGANNEQMESQLKALGELLSDLQITIAKFAQSSETNHFSINQGYLESAQKEVTSAIQSFRQQQEEKSKEANESLWQKIEGAVMSAVSVVLAICTLQPELVALTLAFTVMQYSGGMKGLEKVLTTTLEKMGVPADVASLVSDIVIIAASVIVTHQASKAILTEAEGLSTAVKTEDEVSEDADMLSKVKAKVSSMGKGFSRRAAASLVAGSQAMMSTSFAQDASVLMAKGSQTLEILLEVVIGLMAAVAGGAGMNNLASRGGAIKLTGLLESAKGGLFGASAAAMLVDTGAQTVTGIQKGITEISLGNTSYALNEAKAQSSFFDGLMKELSSGFSGWMDTISSQEGSENRALGSLGEAYAGVGGTVARELAG